MARRHRSIRTKLLLVIIPALALSGFFAIALITSYLHDSFKSDLEQQQYIL
jgi:sensor domain CHASE-containing protein